MGVWRGAGGGERLQGCGRVLPGRNPIDGDAAARSTPRARARTGRHRVVGYGLDREPAFIGEWTTDIGALFADRDRAVGECCDWVYLEAEGVGRVAFDGSSWDMPGFEAYLGGER